MPSKNPVTVNFTGTINPEPPQCQSAVVITYDHGSYEPSKSGETVGTLLACGSRKESDFTAAEFDPKLRGLYDNVALQVSREFCDDTVPRDANDPTLEAFKKRVKDVLDCRTPLKDDVQWRSGPPESKLDLTFK